MNTKTTRALASLVLIAVGGVLGYFGHGQAAALPIIPSQTVSAPPADSVRVLYSLTEKRNDQEIIALINDAKTHAYFAIYEFTLTNVADALVAAKKRGVDVRGVVDSGESSNSYDRPVIEELIAAGIPVETERHPSGSGIMHIKAIVTDGAYAFGSYNWTQSATKENDELLEIGTDPTMVKIYESILLKILDAYKGTSAAALGTSQTSGKVAGTIDYTEAPNHIGEEASVTGILVDSYTSKSGTVFLDFCDDYKNCPFSGVIFASDAKKFDNLSSFEGKRVTVSGTITSYNGQAEIKLASPSQLTSK
jgi:hypothetical protein